MASTNIHANHMDRTPYPGVRLITLDGGPCALTITFGDDAVTFFVTEDQMEALRRRVNTAHAE